MRYSYELMDGIDWRKKKVDIAKKLGISRPTLDAWIRKYRDERTLRHAKETERKLRLVDHYLQLFHGMSVDEIITDGEERRQAFIDSIPSSAGD